MPKLTHSPLNNILVTSPEGIRIHPIYKEVKNHDGIDLDAVKNTPVFAAHPGKVINAGNQVGVDKKGNPTGYGNFIVLYNEATDTVTLYAHLNSINVSIGQEITSDQANSNNGFKIGLSGRTGGSKGNHLHFEVMQGSQKLRNGKTIVQAITDAAGKGDKLSTSAGIASSQSTKNPDYAAPRLKASEYLKKIPVVSLSHKVPTLDAQYNIDFYGNIDPLSQVDDQLFISDKPLSGTALSLTNKNTNEVIPNIWKLKTSDDAEYVVSCLDNNNKISSTGTKLLINPLGATNTENCIIINNFPFSDSIKSAEEATNNNGVSTTTAPFGIKLSNNNQIDFSKVEFKQLSRSVGDNNAVIFNGVKNIDGHVDVVYPQVVVNGNIIDAKEPFVDELGNLNFWDFDPRLGGIIMLRNNNLVCCWSESGSIASDEIDDNNFTKKVRYQILSPDGKTKIGDVKEMKAVSGLEVPIIALNMLPLSDNNFALNWTQGRGANEILSRNIYICNESGDVINSRAILGNDYLTNESIGLSPDGNNLVIRWIEGSDWGNWKYQILDSNGNEVTQNSISIDPSQLPSIKLINSKPIDNTIKQISAIEGDNNIIEITSADVKCSIDGFCGVGGSNNNDKLDFALLLSGEDENARRMLKESEKQELKRFLQNSDTNSSPLTKPLSIKYQQNNLDTVITSANFPELEIILKNFDQKNLKQDHFITDTGIGSNVNLQFVNQINNTTSTNNNSANPTLPNNNQSNVNTTTNSGNNLPNNNTSTNINNNGSNTNSSVNTGTGSVNSTPQIQIKNANQTLIFDQMAASIPFNDIAITPINLSDKFEVKLILTDKNGNPVKGAMITKGETKDGKYRSNYDEKTGIWQIVENFDPYDDKHITGTPAKVAAEAANELLKGNAIHALDQFIPKDFAINVDVRDVTNNQIYNNQIQADYQCMEIPDDLVKSMVRDQKSEVNKTLVMNFVNYLKDPRDRRFIGAEFKLMQAIRNDTIDPISNDSLLEIREFNKTTFEINGNKPGNYTMDFGVEQCNKFINHHFNLELTGKNEINNSNSNDNLSTIIGASIGGAALLTVIGVAIWQRDKIKQCFNYLTGKGRGDNIQGSENKNEIELPVSNNNQANLDAVRINYREVNKENTSMMNIKINQDEIMNLTNNQKRFNSMELPKGSPIIKDINSLKSKNNQIEIG